MGSAVFSEQERISHSVGKYKNNMVNMFLYLPYYEVRFTVIFILNALTSLKPDHRALCAGCTEPKTKDLLVLKCTPLYFSFVFSWIQSTVLAILD